MPRKKIIRKVVDSDKPIKPQEALEILGIVTNNETALDAPVETSVIEEFVKEDTAVEEVPEVNVPKIYEAEIFFQAGPAAYPEYAGIARYRELTNELHMGSLHPRFQAVFVDYVKSDILVTKNGASYVIDNSDKKEWITNLCYAEIGYKLKASEARVYNETN